MSRADFDKPLHKPTLSHSSPKIKVIIAGLVAFTFAGLAGYLFLTPQKGVIEPWAELKIPDHTPITVKEVVVAPVEQRPRGPIVNIVDGATGKSREVEIGKEIAPLVLPPSVQIVNNATKAYEEHSQAFRPRDAKQAALPRIALIISGVGLNAAESTKAISILPKEVTLGMAAPASLDKFVTDARLKGMELLLQIPMEANSAKETIDSPVTLKTTVTTADNLSRLNHALAKVPQALGIMNYGGDKFLNTDTALTPFFKELSQKGLLMLEDSISSTTLEVAKATKTISLKADYQINNAALQKSLAELEIIAKTNNATIATMTLYPKSAEAIVTWAKDLEKRGFLLTPLSAILARKGF